MTTNKVLVIACLLVVMPVGVATDSATAPETKLSPDGNRLDSEYSRMLKVLQTEIAKKLPKFDEQQAVALQKAREAVKAQ